MSGSLAFCHRNELAFIGFLAAAFLADFRIDWCAFVLLFAGAFAAWPEDFRFFSPFILLELLVFARGKGRDRECCRGNLRKI